MDYNDIKDIKLYKDYETFCINQDNCIKCSLHCAGLINSECYDQPCEMVYKLLLIINDLKVKLTTK